MINFYLILSNFYVILLFCKENLFKEKHFKTPPIHSSLGFSITTITTTMEGTNRISIGEDVIVRPRSGLSKYKLIIFTVCCIVCLVLEAFILIFTAANSNTTKESNERIRVVLDNIFLRLLALPGVSVEDSSNRFENVFGNNTEIFNSTGI